MASNTYTASILKTSASDSAWRTDTSNAYQGKWTESGTFNNKRIGYIGFPSNMGTTMASSSISKIEFSMTATASGMGSGSTKTIYFYEHDSGGSTPASQLGDELGTYTSTGFYSSTKIFVCDSSTNSALFNALKAYLEKGNTVLMIYAPNDTSALSGYYCSANYVGFSKVSLTITYTPKYTVSLSKGAGISSISGAGSYASGSSVTVTATASTGYNFSKWTNNNGTSISTNSSYTFTISDNVSLTANATKKTYTISYNANGGSGAPSSQTKTYGTALTLSSTKPTRTGYTFKNWNTKSDGSGTTYAAGASYTSNAAATLYAQWTPYVLTVIYNANGGSQASGNNYALPYTTTANYGTNYNGTNGLWDVSTFGLSKTGYTATKWNTDTSGTGVSLDSTTSYTAQALATACDLDLGTGNRTIQLYPEWIPISYTIIYNANGGSGAPDNQSVSYGATITLSSTEPTFTGHTFLGWSTSSSASSATYSAGQSVSNLTSTSGGTVTLYAVWQKYSYTITYNPGSGSGTATTSTHQYNDGTKLTDISTLGFSLTGYYFNGWATSSGGAVVYSNGQIAPYILITSSGQNINLYASWIQSTPWSLAQIKLYDEDNKKWWTI